MINSHTPRGVVQTSCILVLVLAFFSLICSPGGNASAALLRCYVNAGVSGGAHTGTSWANAFTDLQSALGASSCTEVWVAAGTYKPAAVADRAATFQLKDGVGLYGGFAGGEITREQRNPVLHPTILSGDLNGDDQGFTNNTENVYHVVTGATGATLDGFIIRSGNADATGAFPDDMGGGILNNASSPHLANLFITGNSANLAGAGMSCVAASSPDLFGATFSGNRVVDGFGGGLYNEYGSLLLKDVTFFANVVNGTTGRGGGIYNFSGSLTLTNVVFSANTASNSGGGLYNVGANLALVDVTFHANSAAWNGGGMFTDSSSPTLTNVTFSANSAAHWGGGLCNNSSTPTLTNVTFHANIAAEYGGGMYNFISNDQVQDSLFWGNTSTTAGAQIHNNASTPVLDDSVIQGGCPPSSTCTHILTGDPLLGTFGYHGGYTQTIPLQLGSSAIDSGNDLTCAPTDQRGVPRPQGAHCDIGAYEYQAGWQTYLPMLRR